jgi:hypothetical protein
MTRNTQAVRGALLAAIALLTLGPAPAHAASRQTDPGDWLYVTVTRGDARSSDPRGTLLLCDPPQGHAHAAQACAELATAGGDVAHIPARREILCSMIYAPVSVTARGQWAGRPVEYTRTFPNACVMGAETGAVFALAE